MTESRDQPIADVQVGDFVCFERIGAERDWRNTIGRVLSFPTAQRVRVAWYDRADASPPRADPAADAKLRALAEREGRLVEWDALQDLREQLRRAQEEEDRASASLFQAREATVERQAAAAAATRATMEELDRARAALERVPPRFWRALRSPGRPSEDLIAAVRAMLVALQEDRAPEWEAMQTVLRQPDIMDRVMSLDCAAAPLTRMQRRRILAEIGTRGGSSEAAASAQRSVLSGRKSSARSGTKSTARRGEAAPQGSQLESALCDWLHAQIACSDARLSEDSVVEGCFSEVQDQAVLVREVNIMRENISMLQEKALENQGKICEKTSLSELLLEGKGGSGNARDVLFYQRTDVAGRPVKEIITRKAILAAFGQKEEEADPETGAAYLCLSPEEAETLANVVARSNEDHDVQELGELFASKDREEEEIRELRRRMEELRRKEDFTEDDEEEMRQLDAILTDSIRRHEVTHWRHRQMQTAGRDKRFLEMRREASLIKSNLQVKFSGEHWEELIANDTHREMLENAFRSDITKAFDVPHKRVTDVRFSTGPFATDFTLQHDPEMDAEALQSIANEAYMSEFTRLYETLTSQRTYPLNTPAQISAYMKTQEYARLMNFAGAGVTEEIKELEDSEEGETDDEDTRRVKVELAQARIDFDPAVYHGLPIFGVTTVPEAVVQLEREELEAELRRALGEEEPEKAEELENAETLENAEEPEKTEEPKVEEDAFQRELSDGRSKEVDEYREIDAGVNAEYPVEDAGYPVEDAPIVNDNKDTEEVNQDEKKDN